jgi:catechol 2,3-dioxygenase-like lactoylglutathione lyase family enzyme
MSVKVKFNHVGITVSSLERSIEFYKDAFGLDPGMVFDITAGPEVARSLDLAEHHQRVALIPIGDVVLELIEMDPARSTTPTQDEVGYTYVSFEVDDLDEVYVRLAAKGYKWNSEPVKASDHQPVVGTKYCILKDPDGKNIEMMQVGPGLATSEIQAAADAGVSLDAPYVIGP